MEQVYEFPGQLTDTSNWPPRWHCGRWTAFHGWLYIGSDLTIRLAYVAIPLILRRFIVLNVPLSGFFVLFEAFILFCGLIHLLKAPIFWWPPGVGATFSFTIPNTIRTVQHYAQTHSLHSVS